MTLSMMSVRRGWGGECLSRGRDCVRPPGGGKCLISRCCSTRDILQLGGRAGGRDGERAEGGRGRGGGREWISSHRSTTTRCSECALQQSIAMNKGSERREG